MLRLIGTLMWAFALLVADHVAAVAQENKIGPRLRKAMVTSVANDEIAVVIDFLDRLEVKEFGHGDRLERKSRLMKSLKKRAEESQAAVAKTLADHGVRDIRQLWLVNKIAATVSAATIDELARQPEVERVKLDVVLTLGEEPSPDLPLPGWNHIAIGAPILWAMGQDGQGVVVGLMDSGVDLNHPALGPKWRGGGNGWFDPHGEHPALPVDFDGHGTQTLGLMLADPILDPASGLDEAIGVAPGAEWIAVKVFDDAGNAKLSDIHLGFQWLFDPDGDPLTDDAPDIVNNSWVLQNTINQCDPEFQPDIDALRAVEIAVVFSAGNGGPNAATSVSPPNNAGAFPVGAVDEAFDAWRFSARGPSACGLEAFPNVVAPGVNVQTTDLSFGGILIDPVLVTGTSASAPHVAGGMAILKGAFPDVTLEELEAALEQTAQDLGVPGPDDTYGAGLIDLFAAYNRLLASAPAEDKVKIVRARYKARRQRLSVKATSSAAPDAVLTLPDYGDAELTYDGEKGHYRASLDDVFAKPATVTVESSEGGSKTRPVPFPDSVTIVRTRYKRGKRRLIVEARSDAQPAVKLRLPEFGNTKLKYEPDRGLYRKVVREVMEAPDFVTVTSSGRGRDTEPVPFQADRVTILSASYDAKRRELAVSAVSDEAPGVGLRLPDYDVRMRYKPRRKLYRGVVRNLAAAPTSVTVESSGSGFDTVPVPFPW